MAKTKSIWFWNRINISLYSQPGYWSVSLWVAGNLFIFSKAKSDA